MAGIITDWFVARTVANFDLIQMAVSADLMGEFDEPSGD